MQAVLIPEVSPAGGNLQKQVYAKDAECNVPEIKSAEGLVFSKTRRGVIERKITNCGTVAILVGIGTAPTINAYHFVLAGGSAADDGLGSIADFSRCRKDVYVKSATGAAIRYALYEAYDQSMA